MKLLALQKMERLRKKPCLSSSNQIPLEDVIEEEIPLFSSSHDTSEDASDHSERDDPKDHDYIAPLIEEQDDEEDTSEDASDHSEKDDPKDYIDEQDYV